MLHILVPHIEEEEPKSALNRLIAVPEKLLDLLKGTSLAATTEALVRVKSYHPKVDMVKVGAGADTTKDLKALELQVRDAATAVMDTLDYEGDGGNE
jgi:hypothetical protein